MDSTRLEIRGPTSFSWPVAPRPWSVSCTRRANGLSACGREVDGITYREAFRNGSHLGPRRLPNSLGKRSGVLQANQQPTNRPYRRDSPNGTEAKEGEIHSGIVAMSAHVIRKSVLFVVLRGLTAATAAHAPLRQREGQWLPSLPLIT